MSMKVTLKVIEGPHLGAEFSFDQYASFVVGRHRKSQFWLSLKDPYLSRLHFYLEIKPPQCVLVDLHSSNHTYVNGQRTDQAFLVDGDLIRAGNTTLRVSIEPGPPPPPPQPMDRDSVPNIPGYRVERLLGSGNTGTVYLAIDERDQARVALKVISPAIANCPRSAAKFEREAVILRQLQHPNIISLYNVGKASRELFLVMEYVPGYDALGLMKIEGGQLPIWRAVNLACQALEALAHAHRAGIVHRDVKPNNLLVARIDGRDVVKLSDFGLARIYNESSVSGLTVEGNIAGTFGYMPPEQIGDMRNVGPAADLYGVGGTLYSLLTGQLPYDFPDKTHECLVMIVNEDVRPIQQLRPEVPRDLAEVIEIAMAREPDDRFADADSMRSALTPWIKPPA
jgi:serine/threonine-protein kinase